MSHGRPGTTSKNFFPININLHGKRVLICGGSSYALSTTEMLMEFGAKVDIVSPHMVKELSETVVTYGDRVNLLRRPFDAGDEDNLNEGNYQLALSFDFVQCEQLVAAATKAKVPVYILNKPDESDFIVPSMIKRGHLKISVSTDAISHQLEQAIVQRIEAMFVSEIDSYTLFLTRMKEIIANAAQEKSYTDPQSYRQLLLDLSESQEILHALQRRNFEEANHLARMMVAGQVTETGDPPARKAK